MGMIIAIIGIAYILISIITIGMYVYVHRKQAYTRSDLSVFILTTFIITILSFFVVNHLAIFTSEATVMTSFGYSAVPITQFSLLLLSYPIVQILSSKGKSLKYGPIFFGIVLSAGLNFGATLLLATTYWEMIGVSIYG